MHAVVSSSKTRASRGQAGAGTTGCIFFLVLFCAAAFVAYQILPVYYAHKSFESDAKAEISKAGANYYDDETLTRNLVDLARRHEIRLTRENVKIERFGVEIRLIIQYRVPVDFLVHQRTFDFDIRAGSFVGRL